MERYIQRGHPLRKGRRSEAIWKHTPLDCFVASLLAMTGPRKVVPRNRGNQPVWAVENRVMRKGVCLFEKCRENAVHNAGKTIFLEACMKSKMVVKAAVFLLLFAGLTAGASAQITVSGGFALSIGTLKADWDSDITQTDAIGLGGNVYLDYLLPISIPLSLGLEVGADSASTTASDNYKDNIIAIPLLLRVAYHFDLMPRLDLYLVGKIGYGFGAWSGDTYDMMNYNEVGLYRNYKTTVPSGFAFGFDLGASYYFSSRFGVFIEAGFDRYSLNAKVSGEYNASDYYSYDDWTKEEFEVNLPFTRFLTFGISVKF
jgi:hypothetical protein